MTLNLKAIWEKILRGEPLTDAEQTTWVNRWTTEYPSRGAV